MSTDVPPYLRGLSEATRATIIAAAAERGAQAPPPKDWQVAILRPLFAPKPDARAARRRQDLEFSTADTRAVTR